MIPKFRYYYNYLKLLNEKEAELYLKWLKHKLRYYLQHELLYIKIPNELLKELINPKDLNKEDKVLRNYLSYYQAKSHGIIEKDLSDLQINQVKRIKELAKLTLKKKIRFGIYLSSIKLLF